MEIFVCIFREDLLGQSKKAADDMSRVAGLDNQGIVSLQRQVMKGTNARLVSIIIIHASLLIYFFGILLECVK